MSFTVSGLTDYTEQNKQPLITKALFGAKTIGLMTPMTGIKSSETINIGDTDAVFQTGGTCGFSASGTTTLTQRTVTVGKIKVQEALCPKTLEAKYTQTMLQAGSTYDSLPFEQIYSELKASYIAKQMETAIWQGDTTSGTGNLSKFDGLIKLIDASYSAVNLNAIVGVGTAAVTSGSPTVTGTSTVFTSQVNVGDKLTIGAVTGTVLTVNSATSITLTANAGSSVSTTAYKINPLWSDGSTATLSNPYFTTQITAIDSTTVVAFFQNIYKVIPVAILDKPDTTVFVGMDTFRTWVNALTTANLFHYTAESSNFELVIPGTSIKVIAVNGLNGTNRAFATYLGNMYFGTDLMNEEEKFKIFFAEEADEIRYMAEWKAGCNVAFPSLVVQFTLA